MGPVNWTRDINCAETWNSFYDARDWAAEHLSGYPDWRIRDYAGAEGVVHFVVHVPGLFATEADGYLFFDPAYVVAGARGH